LVDFAGWSMPVQYASIVDEHRATRTAVGLFDVSHMGRIAFRNLDALAALDRLTTRRVRDMAAGKIRYSLMCNQQGGILDDVLVYCLDASDASPLVMLVVNASNREKIVDWLRQNIDDLSRLKMEDRTTTTAMIAVQGPRALDTVRSLCSLDPSGLAYYTGAVGQVLGAAAIISRTGYTGEDGVELIVPAERAVEVWQTILDRATPVGGRAAGLGARDTLRLEAAMPLYGHELGEEINAAQTGLGFAINLKDRDFVGCGAIVAAQGDGSLPRRVGLVVDGRRAAREGMTVLADGREIGRITSGTFAPTLEKVVAMAYLQPAWTSEGSRVAVDIRGQLCAAQVVPMPFYTRAK
jgi:aminomethyltransferase